MSFDYEELKDAVEARKVQLFDVREQDEWDAGHLADAHFVPLSLLRDGECPDGLDREMPTYLHCRSGRRVLEAAPMLKKMGFKNVIPLDEGFEALLGEGFRMGHD